MREDKKNREATRDGEGRERERKREKERERERKREKERKRGREEERKRGREEERKRGSDPQVGAMGGGLARSTAIVLWIDFWLTLKSVCPPWSKIPVMSTWIFCAPVSSGPRQDGHAVH